MDFLGRHCLNTHTTQEQQHGQQKDHVINPYLLPLCQHGQFPNLRAFSIIRITALILTSASSS